MRDVNMDRSRGGSGRRHGYEQSWAVIIGINGYRHRKLKFAVSDAVGIARVLISNLGFEARHVYLVIDPPEEVPDQAKPWLATVERDLACFEKRGTKAVIERLLFTTLPARTGPNDRVLVYFAGHGAPRVLPGGSLDRAHPYLVPADADLDQEESSWHTYIDLNNLIKQSEFCSAKHIFYLLDACCCGLTMHRGVAKPPRYETTLLQRIGRQCLTAGTGEQYVADRGRDNHSIFTWHVLRVLDEHGLEGEPFIGATKLITRVKEAVGKDPESNQVPDGGALGGHMGGEFMFSWPAKSPPTFEEGAELARLLVDEVGLRLDEPSPIALGAALWQEIIEKASTPVSQALGARRERGRALLLLDEAAETAQVRELLGHAPADPDSELLLGIAHLKSKDRVAASAVLGRFADRYPDHPYAGWARVAAGATGNPRGRRCALLIGVGQYQKSPRLQLRGCENDVRGLADVFRSSLDCTPVEVLVDDAATAEAILSALRKFAETMHPEDSFVCYISGNGMLQDGQTIFASYDFDIDSGIFITESQIDAAMKAIPARDKLLITDACHLAPLENRPSSGYRTLFGNKRNELTYEIFTLDGIARGAFTLALENALRLHGNAPMKNLLGEITPTLASHAISQSPGYTGAGTDPFIRDSHPALEIIDLAERRSCGRFSTSQVEDLASWLERTAISAKPLELGIGRALLTKRRYSLAAASLQRAGHPRSSLSLIEAQILANRFAEARQALRALRDTSHAPARSAGQLTELEAVLDQLSHATPHALLVGIGLTTNAPWTNDPRTQLEEVRGALVRQGFLDSNITIVFAPTQLEFLASFEGLISRAGDNPAFFLFLGPGFDDTEIWISSAGEADSHLSDVSLSMLRTIAARCPNLTSAIWILEKYGPRNRHEPSARGSNLPGLGATTLVASPARSRDIDGPPRWDPTEILDLIRTLDHPDAAASAEQWIALANHPSGVSVRGDSSTPLFASRTAHRRALELVRNIECEPLRRTVQLLEKLAQQREHAAESLLNRAVVRAALGHRKEALEDIDLAINQHRSEMAARGVDVDEVPGVVKWGMAHYHRGKILLHEGRYAEAEAALAAAARQLPTFARAHYFRARAIRNLIEADLEKLARDSAHRYIALGAPLGSEDLDTSWQSRPVFTRRTST